MVRGPWISDQRPRLVSSRSNSVSASRPMLAKAPAISRLTKPWRRLQICTARTAVEASEFRTRAFVHAVACVARCFGGCLAPSAGGSASRSSCMEA